MSKNPKLVSPGNPEGFETEIVVTIERPEL